MQRILVGVDGSAASLKAVAFAADLASKYDAELVLMTVVPHLVRVLDPKIQEYLRLEHVRGPASELGLGTAETVLDDARREAQAKGAKRISTEPAFGDPAVQIIGAAKDQHVDLAVVGSRGHGRLTGLLLGSVSQKVISHAPCPVVVVR